MKRVSSICLICFLFITLCGASIGVAGTVNYKYDTTGRLTEADYGDKKITYSYDANGNLLKKETASPQIPSSGGDSGGCFITTLGQ